jgi:hypothetical protein
MANYDVDNLGRYPRAAFTSEETEMGPMNEANYNALSNGALHHGNSHHHSAMTASHEPGNDEAVNHDSQNGSLSAFQTSHHIDAVEPGEDPALPLNSRDVAAFIINKMM